MNPIDKVGDVGIDSGSIGVGTEDAPADDTVQDPASVGALTGEWSARVSVAGVHLAKRVAGAEHVLRNETGKPPAVVAYFAVDDRNVDLVKDVRLPRICISVTK